ncbi:unnamed protein product [Pleuronectes platessa]|uniref:Uncharacterized protein n=1 Tax=Pleuronectes platessa TaxID=8262 RepID=A0A9N7UKW1_PLEPL|nr:unnamed protein product [Pleuronectes platessa]
MGAGWQAWKRPATPENKENRCKVKPAAGQTNYQTGKPGGFTGVRAGSTSTNRGELTHPVGMGCHFRTLVGRKVYGQLMFKRPALPPEWMIGGGEQSCGSLRSRQLRRCRRDMMEWKPRALSGLCWVPGASTVQSPRREDILKKHQRRDE